LFDSRTLPLSLPLSFSSARMQ